jgi:hypothetical protein
MTDIIDFAAARAEREKITMAVAGLIDANPHCANCEGVSTFAFEVRHWNETRPDMFYADVLETRGHADALRWATELLGAIPGWRGALFGKEARS